CAPRSVPPRWSGTSPHAKVPPLIVPTWCACSRPDPCGTTITTRVGARQACHPRQASCEATGSSSRTSRGFVRSYANVTGSSAGGLMLDNSAIHRRLALSVLAPLAALAAPRSLRPQTPEPIHFARNAGIANDGRVAFTYQDDIWVVDADGSNPRRLTVNV